MIEVTKQNNLAYANPLYKDLASCKKVRFESVHRASIRSILADHHGPFVLEAYGVTLQNLEFGILFFYKTSC